MAGYEWHFPTIVDGRPRVCRGMYSIGAWSRGRVDPAERLRARLAELGVSPDGPIKRFAERGYVPDAALASGRRMLVGEAAGIDPITGEGIAPGLAAGVLAGGFLAAVCRGESTIDDWTTVFRRSTVGLDLAIRSRAARLFYGRPRPFMDALLTRTRLPLLLASSYFSGEWWNTRRS
jgi:flavin-dependent dehydrogenase